MKLHDYIVPLVLILISLKVLIVGSEFSFLKWFKHGKSYVKEYNKWMEKKP